MYVITLSHYDKAQGVRLNLLRSGGKRHNKSRDVLTFSVSEPTESYAQTHTPLPCYSCLHISRVYNPQRRNQCCWRHTPPLICTHTKTHTHYKHPICYAMQSWRWFNWISKRTSLTVLVSSRRSRSWLALTSAVMINPCKQNAFALWPERTVKKTKKKHHLVPSGVHRNPAGNPATTLTFALLGWRAVADVVPI